jgi:tetratricopeptide (TPR) repeat protein
MNFRAIHHSSQSREGTRIQWHWNLRLLFSSIVILSLLATGLVVASQYRTSKVVLQLYQLASDAHDAGDIDGETRWLSQLIAIQPDARKARVRLAFARSENAKTHETQESARIAITQAIAALHPVEDQSTIAQLRRELIELLLKRGPTWANEVERQVTYLNAPPGDPQSTLWIAKAVYAQVKAGEWRPKRQGVFQQSKETWKWFSTQPVGWVLEQALEKNPESVEAAAALLDCYFFRTDLFHTSYADDTKSPLKKKGIELLSRLQAVEDGLAQWKCYTCEQSLNPIAAKEYLSDVAPQALIRLQSSKYDKETAIYWDMQLVLAQAYQLSTDADHAAAVRLYRQLLAIDHELFPVKLLENVYVGLGQALFKSGNTEDAIAMLRDGCKRIGKNRGIAIFDTYAAYATTHADVDEAAKAITELDEAIETYAIKSRNSITLRGEARTTEQNRVNLIKWHAEVIRAGFDLRTGNSTAAIAKLTAAVGSQLQIPEPLRVEAITMLARVHAESQRWDLAARSWEDAVALVPGDRTLRLQAAKAFERAGISSRAAEHWKILEDGSRETGLRNIQASLANGSNLSKNPNDRLAFDRGFGQVNPGPSDEHNTASSATDAWSRDGLEASLARAIEAGDSELVTAIATALAGRQGSFHRVVDMARAAVKGQPENSAAWMNLAQAIQLQLQESNVGNSPLWEEADEAFDEAIQLTGGEDPQVWLAKIRFSSRYRGLEEAKKVVEKLLVSSVPDKSRMLLGITSLLQLREMDRAKEIIDGAIGNAPHDIEFHLALADYHRAIGNPPGVIAALEKTVQLAPSRVDIRNRLALALVTNPSDSKSLPWEQVATLIGTEDQASMEKNQLFHAILLASRGGNQQMQQAKGILKELTQGSPSTISDDALRYSIVLDQNLWKESIAAGDELRSRELVVEIQQQYDQLARRSSPMAMDLVQYIDFLLLANQTTEVPQLLERLESLAGPTTQTLVFRIRLARSTKQPEVIHELIDQSVAKDRGKVRLVRILALSERLAQQELFEESIQLLQAAYEKDPIFLAAFVQGLMNQKKFQEALDICLERSKIALSPELITLIADSWTGASEWDANAEILESILERGMAVCPNNAIILESVGSLRLSQFRYKEAFRLLEAANRISPDSLLTLNNLAIAASEIPGKETLGISLVQRAIARFGRIPYLIDSLGLVQLRCRLYREARDSFDEAFAMRPDPRFRLHRIQVDLAESLQLDLGKSAESIDFESLRAMKLTPDEQAALNRLSVLLEKRIQVSH